MRKSEVQKYQIQYQQRPDCFYSFGADLVEAGSPNPCSRSPAARKVLHGRWREAYQMWLADGEYSRHAEEMYVGWMLAAEVVVNKRPPAEVPPLPTRIWSKAEYTKCLGHFEDLEYRNKVIAGLLERGTTPWCLERQTVGALVRDNRPEEAERFYYEKEWNYNDMAECFLALIHTCASAEMGILNTRAMWYYYVPGNKPAGPISFNNLKRLFQDYRLLGHCQVWRKGFKTWQPATTVQCFASFVYNDELPPPVPEV